MFCKFLLYSKVIQLYMFYMYIFFQKFFSIMIYHMI